MLWSRFEIMENPFYTSSALITLCHCVRMCTKLTGPSIRQIGPYARDENVIVISICSCAEPLHVNFRVTSTGTQLDTMMISTSGFLLDANHSHVSQTLEIYSKSGAKPLKSPWFILEVTALPSLKAIRSMSSIDPISGY